MFFSNPFPGSRVMTARPRAAQTWRRPHLPVLLAVAASALLAGALPAQAAAATQTRAARAVAPTAAALPDRSIALLQRIVRRRVDAKRSTGIVAGMVFPDGSTRVVAYGDAGHGRRLSSTSLLEIGSITKTFTATLLADMVQRGEVTLSEPVANLLPAGVSVPSRGARQITLEDLATHRSGLPRDAANLKPKDPSNPYAGYGVDDMYAFLANYKLPRAPGSRYEYSNLGVGLLGQALAARAGTRYEDLVRERILLPLGMTSTTITVPPSASGDVASGHDWAGRLVPPAGLGAIAGAGALRSSITDMLRFAAANLDAGGDELRQAMATARAPRRTTDRPPEQIGLNWHIDRLAGHQITWHNGATNGFYSFIGLDTARRTAIVVLSNSRREAVDDIGFHMLDAGFALSPAPKQPTEIRLPAAVLQRCVGVYDLPGPDVTVARAPWGLRASIPGQPTVRLYAQSPTRFFLKVIDAEVAFTLGRHGRVSSLMLRQEGQKIRAVKVR